MKKSIGDYASANEHKRNLEVINCADEGVQFIVQGPDKNYGIIISKVCAVALVQDLITELNLVVKQKAAIVTTVLEN